MCVYFLLNAKENRVKIGVSVNPKKRLASLKSLNANETSVIGLIPNAKQKTETLLHRKFNDARVKNEWFIYTNQIQDFMIDFVWSGKQLDVINSYLMDGDSVYNVSKRSVNGSVPIDYFTTFISIVELGTFSKAAKKAGMKQPSVSARVSVLEDFFGVSLFDRVGSSISVTDEGLKILPYLKESLDSIDKALGEVGQ